MTPEHTIELPLVVDFEAATTRHPFVLVDVFTSTELEGNQLGVFLDGRPVDDAQMQRLALEVNYPESVFFLPPLRDGDLRVRIFTPTDELPFAGHPVLGAAVVAANALGRDAVALETGNGTVQVAVRDDGSCAFGRFGLPAPQPHTPEHVEEMLAALGVEHSLLPVELYVNGPPHAYVAVRDEETLAALTPDLAKLAAVHHGGVSCFAGSGRHWVSRMFAPAMGVNEDPATGSAAGPLAVHLARHGRIGFGEEIEIHQGDIVGRPSRLYATAFGDAATPSVMEVAGSARIVAHGEYRLH